MQKTIVSFIIVAAVVAGAALLMPTVEADSSYYDWGYQWYPQYQYDYGYGYGYGYDYGYNPYSYYGYGNYSPYSYSYYPSYYNYGNYGGGYPYFSDPYGILDCLSGCFDRDYDDFRGRPFVNLWADDTSIDEGDSTRLRWEVDDADDCDADNDENDDDFEGDVDEDGGSVHVSPDETTTYEITCRNRYGSTTDRVTIRVDEEDDDDDEIRVDLTADDYRIDEGDSTILRWDVDGDADRCRADNDENDNDFDGYVDEDGGWERVRPDETTTYEIRCWNDDDEDTDEVTIYVD